MSQLTIWDVEFRVVKISSTGQAGPTYAYVKPPRRATVSAATQGGILAVLQADIPVGAGEIIEVLHSVQGESTGTNETAAGTVLS